jgi:hypothetical protein
MPANRTIHTLLLVIAFLGGALAASVAQSWARPVTAAHADSATPLYQFTTVAPSTSLTMYSASDHSIYVYQGATTGNSKVSCSYKYVINQAGQPLNRQACPIASLN